MEFEGDRAEDLLVHEGLGFDPFTDSAEVILDHVCDLEPGLFVQSVLEMLDPASLNPRDALRYLQVHERIASWWASRQCVALIAAAGREPVEEEFILLDRLSDTERTVRISEMARDDIAAALRWGPMSTQSRIDQARLLAGPLTATREALTLGEITPVHVRILSEAAQRLSTWDALEQVTHDANRTGTDADTAQLQLAVVLAQVAFDADCLALQHRVLPVARRQGFSRTKAAANRAIEIIDEAGQARRRAAARRHRDVYLTPDVDGLTTLIARLDSFTANAIMGAINAGITNPAIIGSCGTTVGERRSEALAALVFGVYTKKDAPAAGARCTGSCATPIAVNVTIDLTVPISELDTHLRSQYGVGTGAVTGSGTGTGTGTGTGVGTGSGRGTDSIGCDFRQLLADPAVRVFARPVAVNESGHVLDIGRRRYQITGALRRMIITRDGTCRFPGCNAAATRCQIDHVIPWDEGGTSDVGNLGALCTRHHQLKTHGGWELTNSTPDGSCTWRSPQGFNYHHYPEPITEPQSSPRKKTNRPMEHKSREANGPPDLPAF
jgi:hypothetical protein